MNLKELIKSYIYNEKSHIVPESYARFRIVNPEYSKHETEKKPYPILDKNHLFALLWDINSDKELSATIFPSDFPFTFSTKLEDITRTQLHTHDYMELFYIVDGEYTQMILDNEYTFHKGELCLIDTNCLHQEILNSNRATIIFIGISQKMFNDFVKKHYTVKNLANFLGYDKADLHEHNIEQYLHFQPTSNKAKEIEIYFNELLQELKKDDEGSSYICKGLLLRIFHHLCTYYDLKLSKNQKNQKNQFNYRLLERVTKYMEEHMNDISINDLCNEFHFQEDYFNRLFKNHLGLTYTEYLQTLRLKRAESLLMATNYSVDQIAEEVGYHNKGYFYKIFTQKYGMTPAQMRKSN